MQALGVASEAMVVARGLLMRVDDSALELHAAMDGIYDAAKSGGVVGSSESAPVHLDANAVRAALPTANRAASSLKDATWGFYQLAQDNGFVHSTGRAMLGVEQLREEILIPWSRAVAVAEPGDTVLAHGPRNMYWKPVVSVRTHGWLGGSRHEFRSDQAKASTHELIRQVRASANEVANKLSRTESRLVHGRAG